MARRFRPILKKRKAHHKLIRAINKSKDNKSTILAKKIKNAKQYVKNFSSHVLTDTQILLLSKGVKFIPTPTPERSILHLMNDFKEFERRMRCTFNFDSGKEHDIHPFYQRTGFKPSYSCEALENYFICNKI